METLINDSSFYTIQGLFNNYESNTIITTAIDAIQSSLVTLESSHSINIQFDLFVMVDLSKKNSGEYCITDSKKIGCHLS